MTTALEGDEGSASRLGRSLPPAKTQYPLYRRLGGPQGRSGQVRKISPPPEFDPRTVQPVASRYNDYVTHKCNTKFEYSYCAVTILLFIETENFQPRKELCVVNCHKYPVAEQR